MKRLTAVITATLILIFLLPGLSAKADQSLDPAKMSLEEIYQVKPYSGKNAREIAFSKSDRYLAFLWNSYEEMGNRLLADRRNYRGFDLYVYDTVKGSVIRVTSLEKMKRFDPPEDHEKFLEKRKKLAEQDQRQQELFFAQRDFLMGKKVDLWKFEKKDLEDLKKELAEKEKEKQTKTGDKTKANASKKEKDKKELELWELRDKLKEKQKKEQIKARDLYPGVSRYSWANTKDELIFQYRGDLFRYRPAPGIISRLTMSDEYKSLISYTRDDSGYYFSKSGKVFKVKFNSSFVVQINRQLDREKKYKVSTTYISPNDQWMLIVASKRDGKSGYKDVQIMDYSKRLAEAIKVRRQLADDKRNEPFYRFILRKIPKDNYGREPEHIFQVPGGDVWYEFSEIIWTDNSSHFAFMTWEREKGDLKIWLGKPVPGEEPELLFEMKEQVGFKGFYSDNLRFTPNGKELLAVLNNTNGFRQPVAFDLKSKTKRELITGDFESYPIVDFSKDSRHVYIVSDKPSPSMHSVYKVSLKTGKMKHIGKSGGMHKNAAISHNGKFLAVNFGNWQKRPELFLLDTAAGREKILTQNSHSQDWDKYNLIKPEQFTFKNRRGDTIHGMIFKPAGWKPDDKRPGIIYMYGGPLLTSHSIEVDRYSTLSYIFQMTMAAKHGYVTINIDPRGQSGYGRKFSEANFKQPGKPQTEDLEDLVRHIETGFGVDHQRLGLHGWSFGGFQTLMTMFTSPDTFACGIAAASPTEWENYNSWYTGSTIGKSVRGKPTLRKYSLLPLARNLKKPLLLVHGMMDPNVLYQDTLNVYRALLQAGKETLVDLFLDPDGKHSLKGVVQNKAVFKKFEAFFVRNLGK